MLFVVNPMLPDIVDIKREDKPYNYEIDFYYKDRVYERSVELFGLKERYNTDYLMDALRLLDAKDRLTPKSVADAAAIFGMTSEEYFENQFHVEVFRNEHKPFRKIISVNTVDGFQGQERDIIVISMVRSNEEGQIGFLRDLRRMNVAITRARMKLIILGDSATLIRHPFYRRLKEYIDSLSETY